jgi:hypothetical protein
MRDDFSEQIKRALALRVGYRCSRPECGALTAGPQDDIAKAVNVGVAAHITAASRKGPRFEPMLTPEERMAAANGIWLCQNCAKLVDSDVARFTIDLLQRWKIEREAEARRQIGLAAEGQSKRELIVELSVGELVGTGVGKTPIFLFKVANPHERPATIWGAGVEVPGTGISAPVFKPQLLVFPPRIALPMQIADGEGFAFSEPVEHFKSEMRAKKLAPPVQVIGYVTDALGNRHESKPVTFEVKIGAG